MNSIAWLLDSHNFMPHGHCYLWQPGVLWLNVGADALIALSYFAIPAILYGFVRRRRQDIPLVGVPLLFAAFILLCGLTHVFGIWTVWHPDYRLDGAIKLATGIVSAATMLTMLRVIPQALALQTPVQLQREVDGRTKELRNANETLKRESAERGAAEARLRESEERFRLAAKAMRGFVYEYWPQDARILRSDGVLRMLGLPLEEHIEGPHWWEPYVHPDDLGRTHSMLAALRAGADDRSGEFRVRRSDGQFIWIWDHCLAVRDAKGAL